MKTKNIIWGLVLVLIGGLFILKNLDIIYFSWHGIWRLWPVVLVLIGIAILPIKSGIKIALTVVTLIVATAILISFPDYHSRNKKWSWKKDSEYSKPVCAGRCMNRKERHATLSWQRQSTTSCTIMKE